MEIFSHEELLEAVDAIVDYLSNNEDMFYISLEVSRQLRDEIKQILPDVDVE